MQFIFSMTFFSWLTTTYMRVHVIFSSSSQTKDLRIHKSGARNSSTIFLPNFLVCWDNALTYFRRIFIFPFPTNTMLRKGIVFHFIVLTFFFFFFVKKKTARVTTTGRGEDAVKGKKMKKLHQVSKQNSMFTFSFLRQYCTRMKGRKFRGYFAKKKKLSPYLRHFKNLLFASSR